MKNYSVAENLIDKFDHISDCSLSMDDRLWLRRNIQDMIDTVISRIPSDDEIKIGAGSFTNDGNCQCKTCQAFISDFIQGAKWMREQVRTI